MIDYKEQLKLQAFLDGELPECEMRSVADRLARDPDATALLTELRQTREALSGIEPDMKLPESREFYWSKIQRAIQRPEAPAQKSSQLTTFMAGLRLWLRPAMAFALVTIMGLVLTKELWPGGPLHPGVTSLEDGGAFTYHDFKAGITLVWLSYPAEKVLPGEDEVALLK